MASINPFASYVIDECKQEVDVDKEWTLEESLFQKKGPVEESKL
jgi:hypothetical protein